MIFDVKGGREDQKCDHDRPPIDDMYSVVGCRIALAAA